MQFSNVFLFPPVLSWNQVTIPIGLQISILCTTELHSFSAQCVFTMKQSMFLLCETSKFCLHAGGVILHCVPGWMPEKNCIPSWELDCKEANPFMYVCSCFLISDIASVKNLGIALCLDFPCISMCQMSSECFFFQLCIFSHVLIDHYNNVLIIWGSGFWALSWHFSVWIWKNLLLPLSILNWHPFLIVTPQRVRSAKTYEKETCLLNAFFEDIFRAINVLNLTFLLWVCCRAGAQLLLLRSGHKC